ncbi:MAG: hypothetical protein KKD46_03425 [Euryarchaeota archaeon]|nr:hypothetical protein [Euryarchaeota archaeon]MBU4339951.1 hypothetical protein [Euryarchaeota archaeon]MBU4453693.1 hypothetical protein [Euryarchaeota archaeon]MCG2737751.1 hypothetical protein [Candidatus Methanoperedenaceae archaeon]
MVGYMTGTKNVHDLIDDIANTLIASSGGYWTNNDATWNTTTRTESTNLSRRSLKYLKGSETWYFSMEVVNTNTNIYRSCTTAGIYYAKGIRFAFSQTWTPSTGYPAPPNSQTSLVYILVGNGSGGGCTEILNMQTTYYMWIDETGFVIMGRPEPTSDPNENSFIVIVEHSDTKEYTDGYPNVYLFSQTNIWPTLHDGSGYTGGEGVHNHRAILRPWAYSWPNNGGCWSSTYPYSYGISYYVTCGYWGYKSLGNGKVYYVKPVINNEANAVTPIFQSELFFPWNEGVGLIDGDVIALEGTSKKFLCKSLDSPDSTNRLNFAIRYV